MAVTDPSKWSGNWGTGVRSAGTKWSADLVAVVSTIGPKAAAAAPNWQQAVSSPAALAGYVKGVQNFDQTAFVATVNGAGQAKYTASGTTKQAKYAAFAQIFGPKLVTEMNSLNQSNPRGPRGSAQNRARLNAYLDWAASTRGQN